MGLAELWGQENDIIVTQDSLLASPSPLLRKYPNPISWADGGLPYPPAGLTSHTVCINSSPALPLAAI